jgi:hypothetical protein
VQLPLQYCTKCSVTAYLKMENIPSLQDDKNSLQDRIREISDNLAYGRSSESANIARKVSSAIGAETPAVLLSDIRDVQCKTLASFKDLAAQLAEMEINTERRHKEICTILLGAVSGVSSSLASKPELPLRQLHTAATGAKQRYFYGSITISNSSYLIGCILMHLDLISRNHPFFSKIKDTDMTVADVKWWFNVVSTVLNADKYSKSGLRTPKPDDDDFISACQILCSPIQGRRPNRDLSHFINLLSDCSALMNTVEWARQALVKCKGILSPERECRLSRISHPFVTEDQELYLSTDSKLTLPNRSFHARVTLLGGTKRKIYASLILGNSIKPTDAVVKAES